MDSGLRGDLGHGRGGRVGKAAAVSGDAEADVFASSTAASAKG